MCVITSKTNNFVIFPSLLFECSLRVINLKNLNFGIYFSVMRQVCHISPTTHVYPLLSPVASLSNFSYKYIFKKFPRNIPPPPPPHTCRHSNWTVAGRLWPGRLWPRRLWPGSLWPGRLWSPFCDQDVCDPDVCDHTKNRHLWPRTKILK